MLDGANHFEAVMSGDFDFKIGKGHYRGRGTRALVALAIVRLPIAALFGGGAYALQSVLPWLLLKLFGLMVATDSDQI